MSSAESEDFLAPSPNSSGERNNIRGQATRLLILRSAEQLFAELGLTVPLRDIGKAAGQRNHATVQYHFGDRDTVIKAITEYRGAESEMMRTQMVADLVMGASAPTVEDVVSAFVRPLAIHFEPDNHYLQFLAMLITQQGGYEGLVGVHTGGQVMTLKTLLPKLVPNVPEHVLSERWWVMLTSAVHTLARYQTAQRKGEQLPTTIEALVDDLIVNLAAGLAASPKTTA